MEVIAKLNKHQISFKSLQLPGGVFRTEWHYCLTKQMAAKRLHYPPHVLLGEGVP